MLLGVNMVISTGPCTRKPGSVALAVGFLRMIMIISAATMNAEVWSYTMFLGVIMIISASAMNMKSRPQASFLGMIMIISAATVAPKFSILIIEGESHVDESALVVGTLSIIRHYNARIANGVHSPIGGDQGIYAEEALAFIFGWVRDEVGGEFGRQFNRCCGSVEYVSESDSHLCVGEAYPSETTASSMGQLPRHKSSRW